MTEDLYARGLIPDKDAFHFYHADMQLRNLLFAIESPTTIRLTGILDWDSALFAPNFMSTRAPFFLWSEDDADENEEGDAVVEPEDKEKGELKRIFEHVVGRDFHQESYRQEYVLARRMWYFLVNGLRNGGDVFLAEEVLELWGEMDTSGG
jgi:aminoglycoside phosphotransferase (APT) family kinase protein